jgi:hypothetical protein
MKVKFVVFFISMLFITSVLPINSIAGDKINPEIRDDLDDVKGFFAPFLPSRLIERIDINSTWFYETSDDSNNLKIVGKLNNVIHSLFIKSFYSVHWTFNGRQYTVTMITRWHYIDSFVIDSESGESHMIIPLHDGESDIFGFIINKDLIGNPKSGDTLSNTWSSAILGFGIDFPMFTFAYDRAPDSGYGKDYMIEY